MSQDFEEKLIDLMKQHSNEKKEGELISGKEALEMAYTLLVKGSAIACQAYCGRKDALEFINSSVNRGITEFQEFNESLYENNP